MNADRRRGLLVLLASAAAILAVQRTAPVLTPPLYDGVVVVEPYRWLDPPPGAAGGPTTAVKVAAPEHGRSPVLTVFTSEQPPQAQLVALDGALTVPPGTSALNVTITPVAPTVPPPVGSIDGNVYRIKVTTKSGTPVAIAPGQQVTVILRSPGDRSNPRIEQLVDGTWQPLPTSDAGFASAYTAVIPSFGDFAIVAGTPGASPAGSHAAPAAGTGAPSIPAPASRGDTAFLASALLGVTVVLIVIAMLLAGVARRRARLRRARPGGTDKRRRGR